LEKWSECHRDAVAAGGKFDGHGSKSAVKAITGGDEVGGMWIDLS
jgi:hypothetical protein